MALSNADIRRLIAAAEADQAAGQRRAGGRRGHGEPTPATVKPVPTPLTARERAHALHIQAQAAHTRARTAYTVLRSWPLRHQVAPLATLGMLWAGGAAAAEIPEASGPVLLGWTAASGAGWLARRRRHPTPRARRRARWRTVRTAAAGGGWLALAAAEGAWGWPAAVLWVGGYAAAAPWWARHQIPLPPPPDDTPALPPPPPAPELEPAPQTSPIPQLWSARVGAPNRVLHGSWLSTPTRIGPADAWTIQLNPGVHTTDSARTAAPLIASALSLDIDQVTVDKHPEGGMDRAQLLVVDREANPLRRLNYHPGPETVYNPDTGYATIGIHPDEAAALWAFFIPDWGLAGGYINGGIGSGKSTLMTNLATIAAYTRYLSVWAGDPQGGQSMPAIIRRATWPATDSEEILRQLRAAAKAIEIRGALNSLRGNPLHIPTPAEPGILLFLDEIHKIFTQGSEHARLASLIAREGRKAAVAIVGADQYPGLPTFGGDEALRSSMLAKNLAVLRAASKIAKGMIPGLDLDPYDLPDTFPDGKPTSGLGYLVGQRSAPFRGWFTPHADTWMASAPVVDVDRVTANFMGPDFTDRAARAEAARATQARRIAALDPDMLATLVAADPTLAEALRHHPRPTTPAAAAAGPARTTPAGTVLHLTNLTIPAAPTFARPAPATSNPAAGGASGAAAQPKVLRTDSGARIHQLLHTGISSPKDLAAAAKVSISRTHQVLADLKAAGLADNPDHGAWIPRQSA